MSLLFRSVSEQGCSLTLPPFAAAGLGDADRVRAASAKCGMLRGYRLIARGALRTGAPIFAARNCDDGDTDHTVQSQQGPAADPAEDLAAGAMFARIYLRRAVGFAVGGVALALGVAFLLGFLFTNDVGWLLLGFGMLLPAAAGVGFALLLR